MDSTETERPGGLSTVHAKWTPEKLQEHIDKEFRANRLTAVQALPLEECVKAWRCDMERLEAQRNAYKDQADEVIRRAAALKAQLNEAYSALIKAAAALLRQRTFQDGDPNDEPLRLLAIELRGVADRLARNESHEK